MELLNKDQVTYLTNVIELLSKSKIETAIIAPWGDDDSWIISAMTDGAVYALMGKAIEFPGVLTLTRVGILKARLDILKNDENFSIGYTMKDDAINTLELKAGKSSAQYRCGQQEKHNLPKRVFTEILTSFSIPANLIPKIVSAIAAFERGVLGFSVSGTEATISTKDDNGDKYVTFGLLATEVDQQLTYTYNSQVVADLLKVVVKDYPDAEVSIGTKGVLCINNGDSTFYVMASKETI